MNSSIHTPKVYLLSIGYIENYLPYSYIIPYPAGDVKRNLMELDNFCEKSPRCLPPPHAPPGTPGAGRGPCGVVL
jgi:hypothetical protein